MLRLSEIKLPLDHAEDGLRSAIVAKLQISDDELISFSIFKRSSDARRKSAIVFGDRGGTGARQSSPPVTDRPNGVLPTS